MCGQNTPEDATGLASERKSDEGIVSTERETHHYLMQVLAEDPLGCRLSHDAVGSRAAPLPESWVSSCQQVQRGWSRGGAKAPAVTPHVPLHYDTLPNLPWSLSHSCCPELGDMAHAPVAAQPVKVRHLARPAAAGSPGAAPWCSRPPFENTGSKPNPPRG